MPTDKTNNDALERLKAKYGDDIVGYEYKAWKESYLAPPPPRSFCQGMTRYRKCFKVTHVKLKDGSKIPVEDSLGDFGCLMWIVIGGVVFLIILMISR